MRRLILPALFVACVARIAWSAEMPDGPSHVNSLEMRLARIEPGTFRMGTAEGGDFDERPVHQVTITRPFSMGTCEVTNAQYEAFDPEHRKLRGKLGFSREDDEAVVFVSWHDAARFCRWLSEKEGLPYRLPTEAEWEYACRAGTTGDYHTGDSLPDAFHKNVTESWLPGSDRGKDTPVKLTVGQTPPNPWGLHDMHGNAEEWCGDWYGPYVEGDQTDPVGRAEGDFRVTRGGSHSTELRYLRSSNRLGTLPDDKSWLIGFRVVLGPMPETEPLPAPAPPLNRRDVREDVPPDLAQGPDPTEPYFQGPRQYVKTPPDSNGPLFSKHNHCPALAECPNGDLLAIWYACLREPGRELGIVASRLRYGQEEWEPASPFWDTPDRNDHASALWFDGQGTIYHFNGLSAAATWGSLATVMRTSTDSGATWSEARLIMPEHGLHHMPVESVFRTREGVIVVPCDAVTGGSGGTAVLLSPDGGKTWSDPGEGQPQPDFQGGGPGAWIAGIHAGIVQLDDGRLMAFGRGDTMDGHMPTSISSDLGKTWTYRPSPFPPIGGGQRLAILRLREGPIFFASFAKQITITDASGMERPVSGLFAALSSDEGRTWSVRRLITDDGPAREVDGGGNTGRYTMSASTAEPRGYLSVCQTPDGVIQLITSKQHYAFNLAWLETPAPPEP
ncbi:MAG TPA: SUMF1/EgtB/PvdO family nonheme iron enzyme [Thermoguttaceae bacterium]|nr:SUMF1/EgtB/PvdO family nonheme iron enzyme [Thermoguttaceae bacterium]